MAEINCETDFVAREQDFRNFAADVVRLTLAHKPVNVEALLAAELAAGESVDVRQPGPGGQDRARTSACAALRFWRAWAAGAWHAARWLLLAVCTRIGAIVALEGGTPELAHDLAMHAVAASNPRYIDASEMPAEIVAMRAKSSAKPPRTQKAKKTPEIDRQDAIEGFHAAQVAERDHAAGPAVREGSGPDGRKAAEKAAKARGGAFERFEVGSGIEKKKEDFVAAVMAEVKRQTDPKDPLAH